VFVIRGITLHDKQGVLKKQKREGIIAFPFLFMLVKKKWQSHHDFLSGEILGITLQVFLWKEEIDKSCCFLNLPNQ